MASSSDPPFLSSPPSSTEDLQQWLKKIPQTLQNLLSSNSTLPICIFKLPESLTSQKPDSYIPQHIGLGPIHHFRPEIYSKKEKIKLVTSNIILNYYNITSELEKIVQQTLVNLVPVAEYCYDLPFDIDNNVLAWVFAIDAFVLIDVFSKVKDGRSIEYLEDVMMVENQIPLVMLVKLLNALIGDKSHNLLLAKLIVNFCETRSPLKFVVRKTELNLDIDNRFHLLDCMYHLIVNHAVPINSGRIMNILVDINLENMGNMLELAGELFPCLNVYIQPILMVLKWPWDKICVLIKKILGESLVVHKIDIPSVSLLAKITKIKFSTTTGGIRNIEFDEGNLTFLLPVLDLKYDSEVILRNLVAYEELMFKNGSATITNLDFTEYVDFMCGIIDGVNDVKILREKEIILGDMEDKEVVKLFNRITKSSVKVDGPKSKLQKTIKKVNCHYIPKMKVFRAAKNLFLALVVFFILSILLMIFLGICQVYECKDRFGLSKVRFVVPFTAPDNKLLEIQVIRRDEIMRAILSVQ